MIGDFDLFDAWDDSDNIVVKLILLLAIGRQLQDFPDEGRKAEAVRLLNKLKEAADEFNGDLAYTTMLIETS